MSPSSAGNTSQSVLKPIATTLYLPSTHLPQGWAAGLGEGICPSPPLTGL